MGPLIVTFSKTQNNVTTAAFAAWSLQCHYGVTTMSQQRHYKSLKKPRNAVINELQNRFFTIKKILK